MEYRPTILISLQPKPGLPSWQFHSSHSPHNFYCEEQFLHGWGSFLGHALTQLLLLTSLKMRRSHGAERMIEMDVKRHVWKASPLDKNMVYSPLPQVDITIFTHKSYLLCAHGHWKNQQDLYEYCVAWQILMHAILAFAPRIVYFCGVTLMVSMCSVFKLLYWKGMREESDWLPIHKWCMDQLV